MPDISRRDASQPKTLSHTADNVAGYTEAKIVFSATCLRASHFLNCVHVG